MGFIVSSYRQPGTFARNAGLSGEESGGMHWGMEWHVTLQTASSGRLCTFYTEPDKVQLNSSKPNWAATI